MSDKLGYRGYVSSRLVRGDSYPQRVQNLVIRDYARQRKLTYLLSSTEFAMPGCYMMLEDILKESPKLEGLIIFSAFMLPQNKKQRLKVYKRILNNNCVLHTALEQLAISSENDIQDFEDIINAVHTLANIPLNGVYKKFSIKMDLKNPFVKAIFKAM